MIDPVLSLPSLRSARAGSASGAPHRLARVERTLTRCLVCGCGEVRTDEVVDRGIVFLSECPRCEHRWTSSEPPGAPAPSRVRVVRRARREASSAA